MRSDMGFLHAHTFEEIADHTMLPYHVIIDHDDWYMARQLLGKDEVAAFTAIQAENRKLLAGRDEARKWARFLYRNNKRLELLARDLYKMLGEANRE